MIYSLFFWPLQLFMIPTIRNYILTAEGAADDSIEAEEMDDRIEPEVSLVTER